MRKRKELGRFLNCLELTGLGVEIGVFTGRFAAQILSTWNGRTLYLVDPWKCQHDYLDSWNGSDDLMERRYRTAVRRLSPFGRRAVFVRDRSEEASRTFDDSMFDFIYLDANHGYKHVQKDLRCWYPKVRVGGLVCGHDYFDALADEQLEPIFGAECPPPKGRLTSYGVKSAVDAFAATLKVKVNVTKEAMPSWYFVKPTT